MHICQSVLNKHIRTTVWKLKSIFVKHYQRKGSFTRATGHHEIKVQDTDVLYSANQHSSEIVVLSSNIKQHHLNSQRKDDMNLSMKTENKKKV